MSDDSAAGRLQALLTSLGQRPLSDGQAKTFSDYLALFLKWNAKLNLSAIRDEETILRRHFLESIQCARLLPSGIATLLDYGSGGGLPGIPCAICRPALGVTLAESQAKKAAFLRECVRELELAATRVHGGRVEELPAQVLYDAVTLRAVDRMQQACLEARNRLKPGGWLVLLATRTSLPVLVADLQGLAWRPPVELAGTSQEVVLVGRRLGMGES